LEVVPAAVGALELVLEPSPSPFVTISMVPGLTDAPFAAGASDGLSAVLEPSLSPSVTISMAPGLTDAPFAGASDGLSGATTCATIGELVGADVIRAANPPVGSAVTGAAVGATNSEAGSRHVISAKVLSLQSNSAS
jgi:hypothetical protein